MTIGVIPARFNSKRFPGKPLAQILGKSLIQRTYENACKCRSLDKVIIATDDERIRNHVESFGGTAYLTSAECLTGTERTAELVEDREIEANFIVNIQGDEPCIRPEIIEKLIDKIKNTPDAVLTTPIAKITDPQQIFNPAAVKCVFDFQFKALYFSRSPIPFPQNNEKSHDYYRHLGIYCFKKEFLLQFRRLAFSRLYTIEDLEQLKILESGYPIHTCLVEDEGASVDTPEDIKKVEKILWQENTFSLPGG